MLGRMSAWEMHPTVARAVHQLASHLTAIFGTRLVSIVIYGPWVVADAGPAPPPATAVNTLALVEALEFADLSACAERAAAWEGSGLAMPLLLSRSEFVSSLDAFPLEFGDIVARHAVVAGSDPFVGVGVRGEDLRRACEVQAKSHLIHLREGFLEAAGTPAGVDRLIRESIPSFSTLLANLARLERHAADSPRDLARFAADRLGISASLVERLLALARPLAPDEALQLYAPYHDATAAISQQVDRWKAPAPS
jgi:hypothetical protein